MAYTKDIASEIKEVVSLKDITEVYGEIASTRMKKIRGYVLRNREFLDAITSIFQDTLAVYRQNPKNLGKVTFLAHNGKTIDVFLSANTGFFGGVIRDTFESFMKDLKDGDKEALIIGRIGRALFDDAEPGKQYKYFELPDFGIDRSRLSEVINYLVQYEEIRVFYSKFETLITQSPQTTVISAGTPLKGRSSKTKMYFIFEPTIEDILVFFETQMFASVFDQSIRESQLAKFASRILAMDRANQNIQNKLKVLRITKLKNLHDQINMKQINTLSPIFSLIK